MRIGIMCSGNGSNFENIVKNCPDHKVVVMIYNKMGCGAEKRSQKLGIPYVYIKSKDEDDIIKMFEAFRVDLIVLAGWMRIVSPKLIDKFLNRIINIHPSLLPKYKGLNALQQALDSDDIVTGCTVHFVTEEMDSGVVLLQSEVPITHKDTLKTLTKKVQKEEHRILPMVINKLKL